MRGGDYVGIPLSEEVDCVCLALCLSLICEVDLLALCLASKCKGCVVFERGVVYSRYCIVRNPQWRFPVWEVLCERVSENPSV